MNDVSRSYIVLGAHGPKCRGRRFYLDEELLEEGLIAAPDGTGEQCDGCGEDLAEARVTANAHATKVVCGCGEIFVVEVRP